MTIVPGTTLGRYQILEPLGSGGMATVYKAYEPSLDRTVALKVIRAGFAEDPDFAARFRREAQAVAKLEHPNIVHVYAFEETDGRLYLAMQYLEGGTLKDRIAQLSPGERAPWPEAASIVSQVAEALSYAHEQGVVHRDMKPSNIMLTGSGRAVVTDFGIAKIVGTAALTQTGVGIGTPEYMAPEQGAGTKIDHRADIYALGVVAYELLTGRVPFTADTPFAVVAAHMRDPLPLPTTLNPAIPGGAERALLKALAKDPTQRFATAPEFAAALGDGLRGVAAPVMKASQPIAVARPRPLLRPPVVAAIGAAALVVIAATGALVGGAFSRVEPSGVPAAAAASPSPTPTATLATATPSPSPSLTPTPSATPPHKVPAKGALFYHPKLDGTDSDVTGWTWNGAQQGNPEIRYVPGAIEMSSKAAGASAYAQFNMPTRANFVGEIDVAATTASDPPASVWFDWFLRQCDNQNGQLYVDIQVVDQTLELIDGFGSRGGRDHLTPLIPIPGLKKGTTHTVAAVVTATNVTLFLDEQQVADVPYTRCASSTRSPISSGSGEARFGGGVGVVRLTGMRYYALP